jgi:ABC-type nitrate/sulfonate/bicarbonate transport system substrate-binding protein
VYNANSEWAKANARKVEGFLRAILRATDWIYRNRGPAAEIAARELNIKPAYAERAWDFYTSTGTLTRDLSFTEAGLRKVFETQIKAGTLPKDTKFDMRRYVDDGYLRRAKASVKFDPPVR